VAELEEALRCLEIPLMAVSPRGDLFGGDGRGFHDARFDTAAVY
jgi:hypothetical protein